MLLMLLLLRNHIKCALEFEEIMEDNMWHTLRKISNLPANGSKHKVMF